MISLVKESSEFAFDDVLKAAKSASMEIVVSNPERGYIELNTTNKAIVLKYRQSMNMPFDMTIAESKSAFSKFSIDVLFYKRDLDQVDKFIKSLTEG